MKNIEATEKAKREMLEKRKLDRQNKPEIVSCHYLEDLIVLKNTSLTIYSQDKLAGSNIIATNRCMLNYAANVCLLHSRLYLSFRNIVFKPSPQDMQRSFPGTTQSSETRGGDSSDGNKPKVDRRGMATGNFRVP